MGVITDMLLTVTEIAVAPGAVTELQLRIAYIGFTAYGAAMGVGRFDGGVFCPVRACQGDGTGFLLGWFLFAEQPRCVGAPGQGENIENTLAEEQKIIGKRNDGEQIIREGVQKHLQQ